MNKYLAAACIFLIAIFVGLSVMRSGDASDLQAGDLASADKQEAVLVKKGELVTKAKAQLLQNLAGDYYMGNQYAPVLMIEYASLSCPHCASFHKNVLDDLITSHINTGKVKYIYRDFPLNKPALDASKLAMCAEKKNYFNFLKVLFQSQENWAFSPNYKEILRSIAKLGGIESDKFDSCLADEEVEKRILEVKKDAIEVLEVKSTPTIFINGTVYEGVHRHSDVAEYINKLLKPSAE